MKSVQEIVERQVGKARLSEHYRVARPVNRAPVPVITVSREPQAGGEFVARSIAEALGFTYWDHELLTQVAHESGAIEEVLSSLDERVQSPVSDFVESLLIGVEYSQDEYRRTLEKVVHEVALRGSAVLVGRAAHLILGSDQALRVRIVCPKRTRIARLVTNQKMNLAEARQQIRSTEKALRGFVRHHFKHDIATPEDFDLIVNTGTLTVSQATNIVVAAYKARFPRHETATTQPEAEVH